MRALMSAIEVLSGLLILTLSSLDFDPSLTWTVLDCCSAPGSSSVGPSAVAICAVIGGNARKQGVGR
jgi:hypothetical protein